MLCATKTVYEIHHNNIPNLVDTLSSIYNNNDDDNNFFVLNISNFS